MLIFASGALPKPGSPDSNWKSLFFRLLGLSESASPEEIDQRISEVIKARKQIDSSSPSMDVKAMAARLAPAEEQAVCASPSMGEDYIRQRLGLSKESWQRHNQ